MSYQIYVAGPFADRPNVREQAEKLRAAGYNVVARWLTLDVEEGPNSAGSLEALNMEEHQEFLREQAMNDIEDLLNADLMFIVNSRKSEGKAVELGVAIATLKPVIMVGQRTNVFQTLNIPRFDTTEGAIEWMKEQEAIFNDAQAKALEGVEARVVG